MKKPAAIQRPAAAKKVRQRKEKKGTQPTNRLRKKTPQEEAGAGLKESHKQQEPKHPEAPGGLEESPQEAQAGLKESHKQKEPNHPEAADGLEESQKEAQAGLKESQQEQEEEGCEEEKATDDEVVQEDKAIDKKDQADKDTTYKSFPDLSTEKLMKHNTYLEAVRGLKEGQIQEHDFLAMFSQKQKQGLYKAMERRRTPAMEAEWNAIEKKGSKKRKIDLLLTFLKDGLQESQIRQETKVEQGWNEKKEMAWVSWKKILEEYGEEEGKERVKAGLILMRRDPEATKKGVKIWQFLKVDERVQVPRQASQKVQTEAQGQTEEKQHKALTKAIQSLQPGEEDDAAFDQMWLAKKPKHVALEDCEITASEDEDHMEEEEDEALEKEQFLAEIGAASSSKPKKKTEAWNKAKAAAKKAKEKKSNCRQRKRSQESSFCSCTAQQVDRQD